MVAFLFSHCNMVWRSFLWAGGSGCWNFYFSLCFFSAKCGSSTSVRFLIYRVHAVCFYTLVAILDPQQFFLGWYFFLLYFSFLNAVTCITSVSLQLIIWYNWEVFL
jgi:hypothetical protein